MEAEPTLGDVLDALLDEAGDVEVEVDREYARDGVVFATRPDENVIELRLGQEIGEAALRTPDTAPSDRGLAWVRFSPACVGRACFRPTRGVVQGRLAHGRQRTGLTDVVPGHGP